MMTKVRSAALSNIRHAGRHIGRTLAGLSFWPWMLVALVVGPWLIIAYLKYLVFIAGVEVLMPQVGP